MSYASIDFLSSQVSTCSTLENTHSRCLLLIVYSPDMPSRLPIRDVIIGLLKTVKVGLKFWLHYTLVAIAWLGVVPLTACKSILPEAVWVRKEFYCYLIIMLYVRACI